MSVAVLDVSARPFSGFFVLPVRKRQVTIPAEIREKLGLLPNTEGSDGPNRPRWKDRSHDPVKNSTAMRSPSTGRNSMVRFPARSPTTFAPMPLRLRRDDRGHRRTERDKQRIACPPID